MVHTPAIQIESSLQDPGSVESTTNSSQVLSARDKITELLSTAGTGTVPQKGNLSFLPHKFILRGDFYKKIGPGEAFWPEYFAAVNRMMVDSSCPVGWASHLSAHMNQLALMAHIWDWPTCRRWSERVFRHIAEGILPFGWADILALKDLQRDVCATGKRINFFEQKSDFARKQYSQLSSASQAASSEPHSSQAHSAAKEYDRTRDGKPCYAWNWGRDCGFSASHGTAPDLSPHVCAWYAYRYHRMNSHSEKDCNNKKRFLEKKSADSSEKQAF